MNIEREAIRENGLEIPCFLVKPQVTQGAAVIVHGYGGSKEEQLGLAWRQTRGRGSGEQTANRKKKP